MKVFIVTRRKIKTLSFIGLITVTCLLFLWLKYDLNEYDTGTNKKRKSGITHNRSIWNKPQSRPEAMFQQQDNQAYDINVLINPEHNPNVDTSYFHLKNRVINKFHYNFVLNGDEICLNKSPFIIFLIHSISSNYKTREALRESWVGAIRNNTWMNKPLKRTLSYAFVIGISTEQANDAILKENNVHNDIILINITEKYTNSVLKSIMGLYWANEFCSNSTFVVKIDEDVFVHIPRLLRYLESKASLTKTIFGYFIVQSKVQRQKDHKWYVSRVHYPFSVYPYYAMGGMYVIPTLISKSLYEAAKRTYLIHIEDAFITGILRRMLGYAFEMFLVEFRVSCKTCGWDPVCKMAQTKSLMASHPHNMNLMISLWRKINLAKDNECNMTNFISVML